MDDKIERVPIWSVESDERVILVIIASILFICQIGFVLWYEHECINQTLVNFVRTSGPAGMSAIILSLFLIEWWCFMLIQTEKIIEEFRRKRIREGRELERKSLQEFLDEHPNATISDYLEQIKQ